MPSQSNWMDEIVDHRKAMQPIATDTAPVLKKMPAIRAVVFDVYGTLVVSGSGDVGSAQQKADLKDDDWAMREAYSSVGLSIDSVPPDILRSELLRQVIRQTNDICRSELIPSPEVDIVDIWRMFLHQYGGEAIAENVETVVRLATAYEARANPTWPMPDACMLIEQLRLRGIRLGVVSNAQVFTPKLIENLTEKKSLSEAGFDLDLSIFSNRFRQSKPAPRLFDVLVEGLSRCNIEPQEAIYVGNDMLNDIYAASVAGLATAWFAGDQRSRRARENDVRCASVKPDLVLTELSDLLDCLSGH